MINLLIVDDHAIFRAGLRKVLSEEPDLHVVDEASDWRDGLAKLERHAVDVLLLDINLPDRSGLEALEVIGCRFPALRVIMLSMYAEAQYALRAIRSGAHGYVPKDMDIDQLLAAIRRVARGGSFVAPEIAASVLKSMDGGEATNAHERLSARESQVLRMMMQPL
jgi:two-component system, NarL family, invasion response regulator UvrY